MPTATKSSKASCPVSPEQRQRMIAEAAYYRAEQRGFGGGDEDRRQDWLAAEYEIDALLQGVSVSE